MKWREPEADDRPWTVILVPDRGRGEPVQASLNESHLSWVAFGVMTTVLFLVVLMGWSWAGVARMLDFGSLEMENASLVRALNDVEASLDETEVTIEFVQLLDLQYLRLADIQNLADGTIIDETVFPPAWTSMRSGHLAPWTGATVNWSPQSGPIRGHAFSDMQLVYEDYGFDWTYPISPLLTLGSPFGVREDPISGQWDFHGGQDIGCKFGESVVAAADGEVITSMHHPDAGQFVAIDHGEIRGNHLKSRYLHLSRRLVSAGSDVEKGQLIGLCGSTGYSTGPHLHFDLRVNDKAVDPIKTPDVDP